MENWRDLPVVLLVETTSWKDLPSDLLFDILSRLPVKTLIRFTSVCKPWYALIRNPKFISSHFNRSISNTNATHNLLITPVSHSSTSSCSVFSDNLFVLQSKFGIPFRTKSQSLQIIGSINGLICLSDAFPFNVGRELFLWNPSVKKHKHIISSCLVDLLRDRVQTYAVTGFGFHEGTNDYRIVRIFFRGDDCIEFFGKLAPKVEVYSMRTDSWRSVGANVPRFASHDRCVCVNGAIYWLELKRNDCFEWIMSFDLNNEVFGEVRLPANYGLGVGECPSVVIMEFKGLVSVCVFKLSLGGGERCCVWVMKDNGDSVSWTKQFKVVLKERVGWPLRFMKSGKLIMEALDNNPNYPEFTYLFSCDLEKLQFKDLGKDGPYTIDTSFIESLVLLGRGNARFMHGHGSF